MRKIDIDRKDSMIEQLINSVFALTGYDEERTQMILEDEIDMDDEELYTYWIFGGCGDC